MSMKMKKSLRATLLVILLTVTLEVSSVPRFSRFLAHEAAPMSPPPLESNRVVDGFEQQSMPENIFDGVEVGYPTLADPAAQLWSANVAHHPVSYIPPSVCAGHVPPSMAKVVPYHDHYHNDKFWPPGSPASPGYTLPTEHHYQQAASSTVVLDVPPSSHFYTHSASPNMNHVGLDPYHPDPQFSYYHHSAFDPNYQPVSELRPDARPYWPKAANGRTHSSNRVAAQNSSKKALPTQAIGDDKIAGESSEFRNKNQEMGRDSTQESQRVKIDNLASTTSREPTKPPGLINGEGESSNN